MESLPSFVNTPTDNVFEIKRQLITRMKIARRRGIGATTPYEADEPDRAQGTKATANSAPAVPGFFGNEADTDFTNAHAPCDMIVTATVEKSINLVKRVRVMIT